MGSWARCFKLNFAVMIALAGGCESEPSKSADSSSKSETRTAIGTPTQDGTSADAESTLTFAGDIGPIVFEHCASCHRKGGVGPFELLTHRDVESRRAQIVAVTQSGFMPPWLPASQTLKFHGERRLTQNELDKIKQWAESGAPAGAESISAPTFPSTWRLGKPDLTVKLGGPFELPAEGQDVFHNFVMPTQLTEKKYVAAIDFLPTPRSSVHHASLKVDASGGSRRLDQAETGPGYSGMVDGRLYSGNFAEFPSGRITGWTPGKFSQRRPDLAWEIPPAADLVMQLHMQTSGRPEQVDGQLGLYFAEKAPDSVLTTITFSRRDIDIPPGETDYRCFEEYAIPIDLEVLGVYPHAHYICSEMRITAHLPDGTELQLLHIPDWDFNWQDEYLFATPVRLPKSTIIRMDYRYDNSADNPRNPHQPPQRIVWGEQSANEMGDLALLVRPRSAENERLLRKDLFQHHRRQSLARHRLTLQENPRDAEALDAVAQLELLMGQTATSLELFERCLEIDDQRARTWVRYAIALKSADRTEEGLKALTKAAELSPSDIEVLIFLGEQLRLSGQYSQAEQVYRKALSENPNNDQFQKGMALLRSKQGKVADAVEWMQKALGKNRGKAEDWLTVARWQLQTGKADEAEQSLAQAQRLAPEVAGAKGMLADIRIAQQSWDEARSLLESIARAKPDDVQVRSHLGAIAAMKKEYAVAESWFQEALAINPQDQLSLANLARAQRQQGREADAAATYERAFATSKASAQTMLQFAWLLAAAKDSEVRDPTKALRLLDRFPLHNALLTAQVMDAKAAAKASLGEFTDASSFAEQAREAARRANRADLVANIESRLRLYRNQEPFHGEP